MPLAEEILDGVHGIGDVAEAVAVLRDCEGLLAALEPINGVLTVAVLLLHYYEAINAKYSAYECAGTAYGLIQGAIGNGSTDYPSGNYSLEDEETIQIKRNSWAKGVEAAKSKLNGDQKGTALRNKILLHIAKDNSQVETTLDRIWRCLCDANGISNPYSTRMRLSWPATGITER